MEVEIHEVPERECARCLRLTKQVVSHTFPWSSPPDGDDLCIECDAEREDARLEAALRIYRAGLE